MISLLSVCLIVLFVIIAGSAVGLGCSFIWGELHYSPVDTVTGVCCFVAAVIALTLAITGYLSLR